jgi:CHAT domain-containing protein
VILSACNTAGPQGEGAEAPSGMARAFFYAGARALLVSHWAVASNATVKLTTRAFAELKAHPEIGRAEARRVSMRELIEKGSPAESHPSQWAPFVVVGEGAAAKQGGNFCNCQPEPEGSARSCFLPGHARTIPLPR